MKLNGTTFAALAGMLTLAAPFAVPTAHAVVNGENPYQIIWERNPFQLRPPVVTPVETNKPPEPPSGITLTGITTFFGPPQVYFTVKGSDGKEVPKTFRAGDKIDAIEVISIDEKEGAVRLRNAGIESVLTFKKDGAKIPVGAAPALTAPTPGGVVPPGFPTPPTPSTFGRPGQPTGIGEPAFQNAPGTPAEGATRAIPTRSVRVPPAPPGASVTPQSYAPQAALTPAQSTEQRVAESKSVEAQAVMMQINELIRQRDPNSGPMPPLPVP